MAAGITHFIGVRSNLLETLLHYQKNWDYETHYTAADLEHMEHLNYAAGIPLT